MVEILRFRISRETLRNGVVILIGLTLFVFMSCASTVREQRRSKAPYDTQSHHFKTFFLKQKLWTLGDHFNIVDEDGNPRFTVHGKLFSLGDQLRIFDINGNELALIKQKLISLKKQYRVFREQKLWASVLKKITLFKDKYIINVFGPDDYIINGDFTDHHYTFLRNGKPVAFISKKWFSWGDSYLIEIDPNEDDVLFLAAAIVIDMTSHDDESTTAKFHSFF